MMLSILIPVYNFDIRKLISQLIHQCNAVKIEYEIICLDDESSTEFKLMYSNMPSDARVKWIRMDKNIGRAAARNSLVAASSFDNLLFLDCDVLLERDVFIQNYLDEIHSSDYKVLYGSCNYEEQMPKNQSFILHWKYGSIKENPALEYRQRFPYYTFHTVNFLVKKKIMEQFPFDETLRYYGHEDSLWAMQLKERKINIGHIDNPVLHIGLHPVKQFLRNTAQAIKNLGFINSNTIILKSKLLSFYLFFKRFGLLNFFFMGYRNLERKIVKNLLSKNPSLLLYSLYKFGLLVRFQKKSHPTSN